MDREQLIEELKKVEGVEDVHPYFTKRVIEDESEKVIEWHSDLNILTITTDLDHEWENENTKPIDNLEPETILDLFRKWR